MVSIPGTPGAAFAPSNAIDGTCATWTVGSNDSGQVLALGGGYWVQKAFVTVNGQAVDVPGGSALNNLGQVVGTDNKGLFIHNSHDGSRQELGNPGGQVYAI